VYKNLLVYAADKGHLNSNLNRRSWESRFFQFFAGDLYDVIPEVRNTFVPSIELTGWCNTTSKNLAFEMLTEDTTNTRIRVNLTYACELVAQQTKIAQFQTNIAAVVEGRPNATALDFHVVGHTHS
jgi:hypothetical protein